MSNAGRNGDSGPDGDEPQSAGPDGDPSAEQAQPVEMSWRKAWPFLVALGVVVTIVAVLAISNLTRPPEERASDSVLVQYVINDMYTARNDLNYDAYVDTLCAADREPGVVPDRSTFIADNRRSLENNGHIVIPEMTNLEVTGDRATVDVNWHFDGQDEQTQVASTIVVREDGDWKVCNA